MKVNLNPEQQQMVNDVLKSGHFGSVEEVIAKALTILREKEAASLSDDGYSNGNQEAAVREMLDFVGKNHARLQGVSVKQLIHEGHGL